MPNVDCPEAANYWPIPHIVSYAWRHNGTISSSSVPSPKSLEFRCVQNGSSARREEGAYLDRYVTDEQRSRRPIFNATLRGRGQLAVFLRCDLYRYDPDSGTSLAP